MRKMLRNTIALGLAGLASAGCFGPEKEYIRGSWEGREVEARRQKSDTLKRTITLELHPNYNTTAFVKGEDFEGDGKFEKIEFYAATMGKYGKETTDASLYGNRLASINSDSLNLAFNEVVKSKKAREKTIK